MIDKINFLKKEIEKAETIALFWHEFIDWDALWSILALWEICEKLWKKVEYFTTSEPSKQFFFIHWIHKIKTEFTEKKYDLLIFCDTSCPEAQLDQIRNNHLEFFENQNKFVIDHHISNQKYWNYNIINPQEASTCNIIYDIINKNRKDLRDKKIATLVLLWIITDTGCFTFPSADKTTFEKTAKLIEKWAEKEKIIKNIFSNNSFNWIKFVAKLIKRSKIKNQIVYTYFTDKEIEKENIDIETAKSAMQTITSIKEWKIFVLIRKTKRNQIKGSVRSTEGLAKDIAQNLFWWGGHLAAAWFKTQLKWKTTYSFKKQVKNIIKKIEKFLNSETNK